MAAPVGGGRMTDVSGVMTFSNFQKVIGVSKAGSPQS